MHKNATIECPHCHTVIKVADAQQVYPALTCARCGVEIERAKGSGRNPKYCDGCRAIVVADNSRRSKASAREARA